MQHGLGRSRQVRVICQPHVTGAQDFDWAHLQPTSTITRPQLPSTTQLTWSCSSAQAAPLGAAAATPLQSHCRAAPCNQQLPTPAPPQTPHWEWGAGKTSGCFPTLSQQQCLGTPLQKPTLRTPSTLRHPELTPGWLPPSCSTHGWAARKHQEGRADSTSHHCKKKAFQSPTQEGRSSTWRCWERGCGAEISPHPGGAWSDTILRGKGKRKEKLSHLCSASPSGRGCWWQGCCDPVPQQKRAAGTEPSQTAQPWLQLPDWHVMEHTCPHMPAYS